MSLAIIDKYQTITIGGWHLFGQPVLDEDEVARVIAPGLLNPGLRFSICDSFAISFQILPIPFDVNAEANHAGMMTILLHHKVNQHGYITRGRFPLNPDFNP